MPRGLWAEYWAQIPATEARRQMYAAIAAMTPDVDNETRRQWFEQWNMVISNSTSTYRKDGRWFGRPLEEVQQDEGYEKAGPMIERFRKWITQFFPSGEIRN